MKNVKLFYFPKDINIKIKYPNSDNFIDYITTKETIFSEKQIIEKRSTDTVLAVSVKYHVGLIPRKYIKEWNLS